MNKRVTQEERDFVNSVAVVALQGLCANPYLAREFTEMGLSPAKVRELYAVGAYDQAFELLKIRKERGL